MCKNIFVPSFLMCDRLMHVCARTSAQLRGNIDLRTTFCFLVLGVLYHRWGKLDLAEQSYKTALSVEPNSKQTLENLQLLYRKLNKNL